MNSLVYYLLYIASLVAIKLSRFILCKLLHQYNLGGSSLSYDVAFDLSRVYFLTAEC